MFGFLFRAIFDSLRRVFRGQISIRDLLKNWAAALKLPFVYMGLAKDFWSDFGDSYLEMEKGLASTFFVIQFGKRPGRTSQGPAPKIRGAGYEIEDIAGTIRKLVAAGCEVGLHGIDAWLDSSSGRAELEEIRRVTGNSQTGVRMHWLYYDQHRSPLALEEAGAAYDSTVGYNGAVGYRAGTTQVYKPLDAAQILELPLHVMDTALFYPNHLALSPVQAKELLDPVLDNAVHFGGTITINWHDRSVAPERLWVTTYRELIEDLKNRNAWFTTAGQATSWFRKRRAASFETDSNAAGGVRVTVDSCNGEKLPGLRLRIYDVLETGRSRPQAATTWREINFDERIDGIVSSNVLQ
jgi:peptidoglycan/xylan/chitin deacetylase (PgdA/CDA1 family)